ncbi:hypothetical protein PNH50_18915 (plasmid) [Leisingera aquaemixtae]|uniref:hypothetical protein n=1 Tax=Leisingera aquaemixtae TaxID=1396826 RepID=UPI0039845DC9
MGDFDLPYERALPLPRLGRFHIMSDFYIGYSPGAVEVKSDRHLNEENLVRHLRTISAVRPSEKKNCCFYSKR